MPEAKTETLLIHLRDCDDDDDDDGAKEWWANGMNRNKYLICIEFDDLNAFHLSSLQSCRWMHRMFELVYAQQI